MPQIAVLFGTLLFILGPIFYFIGQPHHFTAFIASFFGLFILGFGLAARNPARLKMAMHGAAAFGVLGLLGSLMSANYWPKLLSGQSVPRPIAVWEQLLMFVICLIFVALCVKSFSSARRTAK